MNLDNLYKEYPPTCEGCSILDKKKSEYCIQEELEHSDVLILTDSYKTEFGATVPFSTNELEVISRVFDELGISQDNIQISCAVKCPFVTDKDMKAADRDICRQYLESTIRQVSPKVIIGFGNLTLNMIARKTGITKYRGQQFEYTQGDFECVFVPTFHPFAIYREPTKFTQFKADLTNALALVGNNTQVDIPYELLTSVADIDDLCEYLEYYSGNIAVDLETTGLDFLTDAIMTIAISYRVGEDIRNACIPWNHIEAVNFFSEEEKDYLKLRIAAIFENPSSKKIFHNADFDLKFLYRDFTPNIRNVRCTKIMAHSVDENRSNSLANLVSFYFGTEAGRI